MGRSEPYRPPTEQCRHRPLSDWVGTRACHNPLGHAAHILLAIKEDAEVLMAFE